MAARRSANKYFRRTREGTILFFPRGWSGNSYVVPSLKDRKRLIAQLHRARVWAESVVLIIAELVRGCADIWWFSATALSAVVVLYAERFASARLAERLHQSQYRVNREQWVATVWTQPQPWALWFLLAMGLLLIAGAPALVRQQMWWGLAIGAFVLGGFLVCLAIYAWRSQRSIKPLQNSPIFRIEPTDGAPRVEWSPALMIAGAIGLLVPWFTFSTMTVRSKVMEPTIKLGDHLVFNRMSYGFRVPIIGYLTRWKQVHRGDLVVYRGEHGELAIARARIVPGDTIETREGKLFVRGAFEADADLPSGDASSMKVGERVFIEGDNHSKSPSEHDSGWIGADDVLGKYLFNTGQNYLMPNDF